VPLAADRAPIYQTIDPVVEAGILTRENAGDLQLCRIEGDWARVYLMPMFYWMRLRDLRPDPRTERIVRLELPPNGETPSAQNWCHEAVTVPLKTPVFIRGDQDTIIETRILPRWTPLLACGREGAWSDVQFEGRAAWVETRHLLVSTAQRERLRAFERAITCRSFFWRAKTEQEVPAYRWSAAGEFEEDRIPPGRELDIAYARGRWLWVGFGGAWWYVASEDVRVLPPVFESSRVVDREDECRGTIRRAIASSDVPLYQSAVSDEVVLVVPAGSEFLLHEATESGRTQARYLSVTGWVGPDGYTAEQNAEPLAGAIQPDGFQASTLVSVVEHVEDVPWNWRVALSLGPAVSASLPRPGVALDALLGLRIAEAWSLQAGVGGLVSDRVTAVGSDLGGSFRWNLSRSSFLDVLLAASVARIEASEVGLGVGGRATLAFGTFLVRPYELGLGYTFRGHAVVACTGPRSCEGSNGWFLHAVQLMLSVRL